MEIPPGTWNEFYHALTGLVITEDQGCGAPCGAHQPLSVGRATHFTGLRGESITSREVVAREHFPRLPLCCMKTSRLVQWQVHRVSGEGELLLV